MGKIISGLVSFALIAVLFSSISCSSNNPVDSDIRPIEAIGWVEQNSPVKDEDLFGIDFVGRYNGWIVGENGVILRTTNGGRSWVKHESVTTNHLMDVDFIDALHGWAVGYGGTILQTKDGGKTWVQRESDMTSKFEEVTFLDAQTGWITGRLPFVLLKTTDGGQNWNDLGTGDWRWIRGLRFVDKENGLAIGDSREIVSSSDGGATWTLNQEISTYYISDMTPLESDTGFIVSSAYTNIEGTHHTDWHNLVHQTADGGKSWTQIYKRHAPPIWFGNIFLLGSNTVLYAGSSAIVSSNDGGKSWSTQFQGYPIEIYSSTFIDSKIGWAVGRDGIIMHTTTGGVSPPSDSL